MALDCHCTGQKIVREKELVAPYFIILIPPYSAIIKYLFLEKSILFYSIKMLVSGSRWNETITTYTEKNRQRKKQ